MKQIKLLLTKKGTTLIELLVVISIIGIVTSFTLTGVRGYKTYQNNIDTKYFKVAIHNLINASKQCCRTKKQLGRIYFLTETEQIAFYINEECIYKIKAPNNFDLLEVNTKYPNMITIDKTGFTSDACTIKFEDIKGVVHKLTICVGTGYVEIKNE